MRESVEVLVKNSETIDFEALYEAEESLIDSGLLKGAAPSEHGVRKWFLGDMEFK